MVQVDNKLEVIDRLTEIVIIRWKSYFLNYFGLVTSIGLLRDIYDNSPGFGGL